MDKEQLAIARLQDAARLSEHRYKKPLMVTYSGGKDSQVLVALAERAGINFEVVNSHTTADAPETVYFIREQFDGRAWNQMLRRYATIQGQTRVHVDTDSAKADAADKTCAVLLCRSQRKYWSR